MAADAIVSLLQAAGSLFNLATSIASTTDTVKRSNQLIEFQQALIQLNSKIASVQLENATLLCQKDDAEAELRRMKDWGAEKQRYSMATPEPGAIVIALKKAMSDGEPPHYLCPNCFKQGKASPLSDLPKDKERWHYWVCPNCEYKAPTGYSGPCPAKYAEEIPT
jgi:hypothetical protein